MSHYYRTTRARETGLSVTVCHGDDEGLDTSDANGGAWYTICNEHGFICAHQSLSLAKSFASCPTEWCETCAKTKAEEHRVQLFEIMQKISEYDPNLVDPRVRDAFDLLAQVWAEGTPVWAEGV